MTTGICDVCGTASPLKTCGLCGARVCPRCMAGQICQMCARGRQTA